MHFATARMLAALLLFAGAAAYPSGRPFRVRTVRLNRHAYALFPDVARYYGMRLQVSGRRVRLLSRYSNLEFTVHARECRLNGVAVHLALAVEQWRRIPLLGCDDFLLLLDPILRCAALPRQARRVIVLDPGHGGKDTGAVGKNRLREKDLVLAVAREAAALLRRKGARVVLTRTRDADVSLARRTGIARKYHAGVFVSLHANANRKKSVRGCETFLLTPKGMPSTYTGRVSGRTYRGNGFDRLNARLAYEIQKHVVAQTGCLDRGVKHARFVVLKQAPCPAVLIEMGFVTNPREGAALAGNAYRKKLARGIAEGIAAYIRCTSARR